MMALDPNFGPFNQVISAPKSFEKWGVFVIPLI